MDRTAFEGLRVLRREHAASAGDSEICRGRDGLDHIRLRVREDACRRDCLRGGVPACARLEGDALELLYPYESGESLREWLFARRPGLGLRREMCLSLLGQCLEDDPPPWVLALSARTENLRLTGHSARLLYLPDWGNWRQGLAPAHAVGAVARLCRDILTGGDPQWPVPGVELRLVLLRTREDDYESWGKLQRDLAALPDAPPTPEQAGREALRGIWNRTRRLQKPLFCALTAAALVLALLSLGAEGLRRRDESARLWPGMTTAAGQEWGEGP